MRFFKREPGKNAKNRPKRRIFRDKRAARFFPDVIFGKHSEKNGVFRLILACFAVILLD